MGEIQGDEVHQGVHCCASLLLYRQHSCAWYHVKRGITKLQKGDMEEIAPTIAKLRAKQSEEPVHICLFEK